MNDRLRPPPPPEPDTEGPPGREGSGPLLRSIDRILSPLPESTIGQVTVVAVLLIAVADSLVSPQVPLLPLYLVPIAVAAWYADRWGSFNAVLAAGATTVVTFLGPAGTASPAGATWGLAVHLVVFLVVADLTRRLREAGERRRLAARTDWLTGLANTRAFLKQLAEEIDRALRYGRIFTVAYLDLDKFKEVNDTMGHAEGDELLRRVAGVMKDATRATDVAARLGGDEFAVLLPETPYAQAEGALNKLRKRLNEAMEEGNWAVTVSIGAVTFEAAVNSADEAVRIADRLMYEVKGEGGDGIRHILWTGEETDRL